MVFFKRSTSYPRVELLRIQTERAFRFELPVIFQIEFRNKY